MENPEYLTEPIGIRVNKELRERLEQLAAEDKRPLSTYVRLVLEEHVQDKTAEKEVA